jgi:hypothetical protein
MLKKLVMVVMVVMVTLTFGTMVLAEETKGTISAVGDKEITVKAKDGTETKLKTSSKRTTVKGGALGDLKEGTKVTVTHDGKEASTIEVR